MKIDVPLPLSEFLRVANEVTAKVEELDGPGYRLVRAVDDLIRNELFGAGLEVAPVPANLAVASYYSFLAAVRVALSGQVSRDLSADSSWSRMRMLCISTAGGTDAY